MFQIAFDLPMSTGIRSRISCMLLACRGIHRIAGSYINGTVESVAEWLFTFAASEVVSCSTARAESIGGCFWIVDQMAAMAVAVMKERLHDDV